ncbi:MAG: hypothetical protein ABEH86_11570 [Haloarcula sp.]
MPGRSDGGSPVTRIVPDSYVNCSTVGRSPLRPITLSRDGLSTLVDSPSCQQLTHGLVCQQDSLHPPAFNSPTAGETLTVNQDGTADYQSIQAADSGDTVEVRPGTYCEQVITNDSITLAAPDREILDSSRFTNGTR